jgi:hypothetical protein
MPFLIVNHAKKAHWFGRIKGALQLAVKTNVFADNSFEGEAEEEVMNDY